MPKRRSSTNVRADARRNLARIVDVARATFGKHGTGVGMDEIARRAGVGVGTLYRHFPTKEALIAEIVREQMEQIAKEASAYAEEGDAGAAFFAFLERLWRTGPQKKALADALAGTPFEVRAIVAGSAKKLKDELRAMLSRAQAAGAVRRDVEVTDVLALLGASLWATQRGGARDRLFAILCDGLRPPRRRVTV